MLKVCVALSSVARPDKAPPLCSLCAPAQSTRNGGASWVYETPGDVANTQAAVVKVRRDFSASAILAAAVPELSVAAPSRLARASRRVKRRRGLTSSRGNCLSLCHCCAGGVNRECAVP